jgi:hypothetical protein
MMPSAYERLVSAAVVVSVESLRQVESAVSRLRAPPRADAEAASPSPGRPPATAMSNTSKTSKRLKKAKTSKAKKSKRTKSPRKTKATERSQDATSTSESWSTSISNDAAGSDPLPGSVSEPVAPPVHPGEPVGSSGVRWLATTRAARDAARHGT